MTRQGFTLHDLAEVGYITGLATIGEAASHVRSHFDPNWLIDKVLDALVDGHEGEPIELYITEEDKRRLDAERDAEESPMTSKVFTLRDLAEAGYIMGLATIGEVASHVECHYDAYWLISEVNERSAELSALVAGHEGDPIEMYITDEDKRRMDAELDAAMNEAGQ